MAFRWYIFSGLTIMMMCAPTKSILVDNLITEIEKVLMKPTDNCTAIKTLFGLEYYQLVNDTQPDISKLALVLHNKNKMTYFKLADPSTQLFESPNYKKNLPMTIFIHGFFSTQTSDTVKQVTSALLDRGGMNVFSLDTGSLIQMTYLRASTNVMIIGKLLGKRLAEYVKGGVNRSVIHIIGHSLGAHVAGFAGKTFNSEMGSNFGRISGLDPAGPCFVSLESKMKLYKTDADFVDVIHTDGGVLGIIEPLGHVDFYPNNGQNQPNALIVSESHSRAWMLYTESIIFPKNFQAVLCQNWNSFLLGLCKKETRVIMGYDTPITTIIGIYYLRTAGSSLFGLGYAGSSPGPNALENWNEAYFARIG